MNEDWMRWWIAVALSCLMAGLLMIVVAIIDSAHGGDLTTTRQWRNYTNEVGRILNAPRRRIDPKHNPADRPLKDPWAWERLK